MRFMQLSDTHIRKKYSDEGIDALLGQKLTPAENLTNLLERTDWRNYDFLVVTGDLVHEGISDDYDYLKQIFEKNVPKDMKVLYVLGNHDHKGAFYRGFYGEDKEEAYYYTSTIDGYKLIILDSAVPGKESGTVSREQIEWLKQVLAEPAVKGSILFLHHPVFWNAGGAAKEITNSNEVLEVLEGSDVFAIFCGHTHENSVQNCNGITQYTADSTAFSIEVYRGMLAFTDKAGYLTTEINDDKVQVHYETVEIDTPVVEYSIEEFAKQLASMDE